jgi:phosphoribosylglycinamide formyltransferase 1
MKHTNSIIPPAVVVLISGRGSNLQALLSDPAHGRLYRVVAVISNQASAGGLQIAQNYGIATRCVEHRQFADRSAFEDALTHVIDEFSPKLVVLAGFMRILTADFVQHYAGRLINIHPSLLPAFPGLDTHERALHSGVALHGATVHFVTPELDHGPIVAQAAVLVQPEDTTQSLAQRVLVREHQLLSACVAAFCQNALQVEGMRVQWSISSPPVFIEEK